MAGPARKTRSLFRLISERFRPHWLWFVIGTACAAVTDDASNQLCDFALGLVSPNSATATEVCSNRASCAPDGASATPATDATNIPRRRC